MNFICHDILPVYHPEWFLPGTCALEKAWVKKFAPISRMICVSKAVWDELEAWLMKKQIKTEVNPEWVHNGFDRADFHVGSPSCTPEIPKGDYCLLVGTIEPRKGQQQTLAAFEDLWAKGSGLKLVFAGREGWKVKSFCNGLKKHPECGKRLFWYDNCSDTELGILYENCSFVLVASQGEGFGLPLLEALGHGKRVLCRDLPVFREVGGTQVYYFSGEKSEELAKEVRKMEISVHKVSSSPLSDIRGWAQCASEVWQRIYK